MKRLTKTQFYILSFTWGLIMTLIGCCAAACFIIAGYRPSRNQYGWVFKFGKGWGGLNLGIFSFVSESASTHTLNHEFGHSIQNCYFGPFMILIALASVVRYHYRNLMYKLGKDATLPPYDSIWFEGDATRIGEYYYNN